MQRSGKKTCDTYVTSDSTEEREHVSQGETENIFSETLLAYLVGAERAHRRVKRTLNETYIEESSKKGPAYFE